MNLALNRTPIPPVPTPNSAPQSPSSPNFASSKNHTSTKNRTPSTPESSSEPSLSDHISKLENFYASNGDEEYIFGLPSRSGARAFPSDIPNKHARALNLLQVNPARAARLERSLLESLPTPLHKSETAKQEIFDTFISTPTSKEILSFAVAAQNNFESSVEIVPSSLNSLLNAYPTPSDFTPIESEFINLVATVGNKKTLAEYKKAIASFKHSFYGERQAYSDAISALRLQASESVPVSPEQSSAQLPPRQKVASLGHKTATIAAAPERDQTPERLIKDCGFYQINKGALTGNPRRVCEDTYYANPDLGFFSVFDAAGGEGSNPAAASQIAAQFFAQNAHLLNTKEDFAKCVLKAHEAVLSHAPGHITTAVFCRVFPTPDKKGKFLAYGNIGDSRLYLVRNNAQTKQNELLQLTTDEGEGRLLYNGLGHPNFNITPNNFGAVALKPGDRLLLCSDGITGDNPPDFIPDQELADHVMHDSCANASASLCLRATKIDDRTATVVEV